MLLYTLDEPKEKKKEKINTSSCTVSLFTQNDTLIRACTSRIYINYIVYDVQAHIQPVPTEGGGEKGREGSESGKATKLLHKFLSNFVIYSLIRISSPFFFTILSIFFFFYQF